MSASQNQCNQAQIFLESYKQAVWVIKKAAQTEKLKDTYEQFADNIIRWRNGTLEGDESLKEKIRQFQFSHYIFLKYLPGVSQCKTTSEFLSFMKNAQEKMKSI